MACLRRTKLVMREKVATMWRELQHADLQHQFCTQHCIFLYLCGFELIWGITASFCVAELHDMGCVAVKRTQQETPELLQGLLVVHLCLEFNGCSMFT